MMSAYGQFDFNQVKSAVENVVDFVQQASDNVNCEFYCPTGKLNLCCSSMFHYL